MKRKVTLTQEYDLSNMSFEEVLKLAFDTAREKEKAEHGRVLTYEMLALRCGMKSSTMHQYFTNPNYNPPTRKIPIINRGLGNHIITEWLCIQDGGIFARVDGSSSEDMNIIAQVNRMNETSAAVIGTTLKAVADGTVTKEEARQIAAKLREHARTVEQASLCAEGQCTTGRA